MFKILIKIIILHKKIFQKNKLNILLKKINLMIAISGANGFLGKHCKIYCRMNKLKNVIFIDKKNYRNKITIDGLKNCKTFIHLAGINRSKKKI